MVLLQTKIHNNSILIANKFSCTCYWYWPFPSFSIRYVYPKQLLSQQFWHPDQKKEFVLEEYEKRSQSYQSLVKEVGITSKEIKSKELLQLCYKVLYFAIYLYFFCNNFMELKVVTFVYLLILSLECNWIIIHKWK